MVDYWHFENTGCSLFRPNCIYYILVGCKRDIAMQDTNNREVSEDEARAWAQFNNIPYVETSAKSGLNVEDTFAILTQLIYDRIGIYVFT